MHTSKGSTANLYGDHVILIDKGRWISSFLMHHHDFYFPTILLIPLRTPYHNSNRSFDQAYSHWVMLQ